MKINSWLIKKLKESLSYKILTEIAKLNEIQIFSSSRILNFLMKTTSRYKSKGVVQIFQIISFILLIWILVDLVNSIFKQNTIFNLFTKLIFASILAIFVKKDLPQIINNSRIMNYLEN